MIDPRGGMTRDRKARAGGRGSEGAKGPFDPRGGMTVLANNRLKYTYYLLVLY